MRLSYMENRNIHENYLQLEFKAYSWEKVLKIANEFQKAFVNEIKTNNISFDLDEKAANLSIYYGIKDVQQMENEDLMNKIRNFKLNEEIVFTRVEIKTLPNKKIQLNDKEEYISNEKLLKEGYGYFSIG